MTTTNKFIKFINIKSNAHGTIKHHSKTLVKIGLKDVLSSQKEKGKKYKNIGCDVDKKH